MNDVVNTDRSVLLVCFLFIGLCLSIAVFHNVVEVQGEIQKEQEEQEEQNGDIQRESKRQGDNFEGRDDNQSETVKASKLNIELVAEGLEFPTTMAFCRS